MACAPAQRYQGCSLWIGLKNAWAIQQGSPGYWVLWHTGTRWDEKKKKRSGPQRKQLRKSAQWLDVAKWVPLALNLFNFYFCCIAIRKCCLHTYLNFLNLLSLCNFCNYFSGTRNVCVLFFVRVLVSCTSLQISSISVHSSYSVHALIFDYLIWHRKEMKSLKYPSLIASCPLFPCMSEFCSLHYASLSGNAYDLPVRYNPCNSLMPSGSHESILNSTL